MLQNPSVLWGVKHPLDNCKDIKASFHDFSSLIFSRVNALTDKSVIKLSQNMENPLSHYFIRTSRFIYESQTIDLNGNWLNYFLYAMKTGCRCMEISLYNAPGGRASLVFPDKNTDPIY